MSVVAWLAAGLIGVMLGLLGAGGSILTVPVLVYLLHQPDKVAIASSLAIVGAIASAGAVLAGLRHRIHWRSVVLFGGAGIPGALVGGLLSRLASGSTQLTTFAVVMLAAAWFTARGRPAERANPQCQRCGRLLIAEGAAVGILTGFVGVGGGFLIVPALMLLGGLPIERAIGTSLAVIALNSWTGLVAAVTASAGGLLIDWSIVSLFVAAGVVGSVGGQVVSGYVSPRGLRLTFAVSLVTVGGFVLARSLLQAH